jgi:hydroxymethylpyrimidine pyrophosphatase-like HAD family hydrolase
MLKAVKYGFAMEHSKEGVRAATSYMTKQVEPVLEKLIRAKGKIEEVI